MPTTWTQETVGDSGTATSTSTPGTTMTKEVVGLSIAGEYLSIDSIKIDGVNIGHEDDTDLMVLSNGTLSVNGILAATGNITAGGNVVVTGNTTIGGDLTITGGNITNAITIDSNLTVAGNLSVTGNTINSSIGTAMTMANGGGGQTDISFSNDIKLNTQDSKIFFDTSEDKVIQEHDEGLWIGKTSASASSVNKSLTIATVSTSGSITSGIGVGIDAYVHTTAVNPEVIGSLDFVTTDVSSGSEDADFVVNLMASGNTAAEKFRITSLGNATIAGDLTISGGNITNALTCDSTLISSGLLTATSGVKLGNNIIYASDGDAAITTDTSSNVTIAGDLTVSGGDINGGKLDMAIGEKTIVIGEGAGALQDAHSRGNTFLGYEAGANSKAVGVSVPNGYNTFIGYRAGKGATSFPYSNGSWGNVAIGSDSFLVGGESSTCIANVSVGQSSLKSCQDGKGNTAIGSNSLENLNKDGQNNNTCIGYLSGYNIDDGEYNTLVGAQCGDNIEGGTCNVMIGNHISASTADVNYEIVIGAGLTESADFDGGGQDTIRIGRAAEYMTGDLTSNTWAHGSDARIKKDILDNKLGLDFINDLRTVNYKKKAPSEYPKEFKAYDANQTERNNPDRIHYGFIAQEVKEAMDKVGHSNFPMWKENSDGMQELAEAELIAPLVKAIQELSEKVESLENNKCNCK